MDIVNEYRNRIHQAETLEQKQALAAELHQLTDTFNAQQTGEYELAMRKLQQDIAQQLDAISPVNERALAILNRYANINA